jgi:hypothetical protein
LVFGLQICFGQIGFVDREVTDFTDSTNSYLFTDINIDGNEDIVTYGSTSIDWYENSGFNGLFLRKKIITEDVFGTYSIVVLDFDNDGDDDIVSASQFDNKLAWYENIGGGVFNSRVFLINNANIRDLNFDDIDNDGDFDVAFYSELSSGSLRVYTNNGSGNFSISATVSISANSTESKSIELSDIDNDLDLDILLTINEVLYFSENINNSNSFSSIHLIAEDVINLNDVKSTDLTNNGNQDIILSSNARTLSLLENTGNQNFSDVSILASDAGFSEYILAADLNGDGFKDVIFSSQDGNIIGWYENIGGDQLFGPQQIIITEPGIPKNIIARDVDNDGDGDEDILIYSGLDDSVSWLEHVDSNGDFDPPILISNNALSVNEAHAADLDSDVMYMSNEGEDSIFWHENLSGLGDFGERILIYSGIGANESAAITSGDLDNDGDQDIITTSRLVVGGSDPDEILWIENIDGLATFDPPKIISLENSFPLSVFITDMDNDGDNDVLSSSRGSDKIFWHYNIGIVSNEISGYVRLNLSDDICNSDNVGVPYVRVTASGEDTSYSTYTMSNEFYQIFVGSGEFTTSISSSVPSYYVSNPNSFSSTFNSVGGIDTMDFCIEPIATVNDLAIAIYPVLDDPRAGLNTFYNLVYKNIGTTILTGNVVFTI